MLEYPANCCLVTPSLVHPDVIAVVPQATPVKAPGNLHGVLQPKDMRQTGTRAMFMPSAMAATRWQTFVTAK